MQAMRVVIRMHGPKTPRTRRATLQVVITNPPSIPSQEMEHYPVKVVELMHKYEVLAGRPLGEDMGGHSRH